MGVEVVGPTFDNLPWIEFGSKEWGRAHIALCEAAVRDAWLPAARQVTADNVAAQLESMTSGTEVGAVVLRVFVQFMATVPPEGDAPDAVTATARALADVRRMLGGSCSEIGRTFVLAADHLYPKPLPVRPAPVRQRRWKGMTEVEKKALAVSLASGCATRTAVWDAVAKVCGVKARTAARWFEREEAKASGSAFGRALGEALRLGARQMSES